MSPDSPSSPQNELLKEEQERLRAELQGKLIKAFDALLAEFANTPDPDLLQFSNYKELLADAVEVEVTIPQEGDPNIPPQLASSRHSSFAFIIKVINSKGDSQFFTVIAKSMLPVEGKAETIAYTKIGNLPHLDVFAIIGQEMDAREWVMMTISQPQLVALETQLKGQIRQYFRSAKTLSGVNADAFTEQIAVNIAELIMKAKNLMAKYHDATIWHRDANSRNFLIDVSSNEWLLCDFEFAQTTSGKDSPEAIAESEKILTVMVAEVTKFAFELAKGDAELFASYESLRRLIVNKLG